MRGHTFPNLAPAPVRRPILNLDRFGGSEKFRHAMHEYEVASSQGVACAAVYPRPITALGTPCAQVLLVINGRAEGLSKVLPYEDAKEHAMQWRNALCMPGFKTYLDAARALNAKFGNPVR